MFQEDAESITERVVNEMQLPHTCWTGYSLAEIRTAYGGLIGLRNWQRSRHTGDIGAWTKNGEYIRRLQPVLAAKWAESGKPALLGEIATVDSDRGNPDLLRNYNDLLLVELLRAYNAL